MYLCISGFLPDATEDDSLKFELILDRSFNERIVALLGHRCLNAMAECEWLLTPGQARTLSELIDHPLPEHLRLFIGVEA
jgi:hypothetical protein